jgi:hypothetical protein
MPRTITKSVGKNGVNQPHDVKTVQELINDSLTKVPSVGRLTPDGRIGPLTIGAIEEFQRKVVGIPHPDGRVDPGGRTWTALSQGAKPVAPATSYRVVFQHGTEAPSDQVADKKDVSDLYESKVSVTGGTSGSFRASIYPDDMSQKGRIKDGTYDLYLGFHKRAGHVPPTAADLVARTQNFRAVLVVNNDSSVPVISENPSKTTSSSIHVHNGFYHSRGSEGCLTLHPDDWEDFIQLFLDAYPDLSDWTENGTFTGKKIGQLEVKV